MKIKYFLLLATSLTIFEASSCRPRSGSRNKAAADYDGFKTAEEFRGREIWYKSANNSKFHTYTMPQRLGIGLDWYRILRTDKRASRFDDWGIINDPDCTPGDASTFYLDKCPDDNPATDGRPGPRSTKKFYDFVGNNRETWDDPGCYLSGAFVASDCELGFGTSTGVLGYRKFPNPRFDKVAWDRMGGWDGYSKNSFDGSIEPPVLIGTSCGSCHISFDPRNPPANPNAPKKENIHGLVGNQYQIVSPVLAAGMPVNSVEWQTVISPRPGALDTSAMPTDWVYNPGTANAMTNLDKRPRFQHKANCNQGVDANSCRQRLDPSTPFDQGEFGILKGGEDDIGGAGAILRVYVNIGTCAEQCWVNHLKDGRSLSGRGAAQTPFNAEQCKRDCGGYRTLTDHYSDVLSFFVSDMGRPTDLYDAMKQERGGSFTPEQFIAELGGKPKLDRGQAVFAKNCAECHSSQVPPDGSDPTPEYFTEQLALGNIDFLGSRDGVRTDWLGNERLTAVPKIGTNYCRALHSNHLKGRVWDEFSSNDYKTRPLVPSGGDTTYDQFQKESNVPGLGYYRNPSLLSVWAQAPLLHNNAIGPEVQHQFLDPSLRAGSVPAPVSVQARVKEFEASMNELLSATRVFKTDKTQAPSEFSAGPMSITIPKGTPVSLVASINISKLIHYIDGQVGPIVGQDPVAVTQRLNAVRASLTASMASPESIKTFLIQKELVNCSDIVENKGHNFGVELSSEDKDALIAFMKQF
jgi:hypothetical protein